MSTPNRIITKATFNMLTETEVELMGSEVAIGQCVILNDVDQPCTKLVAVVTNIANGCVYAVYLSPDINVGRTKTGKCSSPIMYVTPLNAFGVRIWRQGNAYRCVPDQTLPITAEYPDRKPRVWQERHEPYWRPARVGMLQPLVRTVSK